jgi:hypothetical protein
MYKVGEMLQLCLEGREMAISAIVAVTKTNWLKTCSRRRDSFDYHDYQNYRQKKWQGGMSEFG